MQLAHPTNNNNKKKQNSSGIQIIYKGLQTWVYSYEPNFCDLID